MDDLISRQAAIDAIDEYIEKNRRPDFIGNMVWVSGVADAMRIVSELPSVQPDMSGYSGRLWKLAYERGKRDAYTEMEGAES